LPIRLLPLDSHTLISQKTLRLLPLDSHTLISQKTLRLLPLEQLESTLLGDVAEFLQLLNRLEASGMFPLADNAAGPGLHKVLLLETTGGVVRSTMPNLGLASNCRCLCAACLPVLACVHFYY
jgi:hypothetical protein